MTFKTEHSTAQEDKIPFSQKVGFGLGTMATNLSLNSTANTTNLIYNMGLGVDPALIGIAQGLPRVLEAFTDPLMGNISDNTRSRFGRRIPYIFVGGFAIGITFALLWMADKSWGQSVIFGYFLLMSMLFYMAITLFDVPRGALGFEMTNDYHERTRLFAYASLFINVGSIATPWIYFLANRSCFKDEVHGMKYVGIVLGSIVVIAAMICCITCKEQKLKQVKTQEKIKLIASVTATCKNRTFMRLTVMVFLVALSFHLVNQFGNCITVYYIFSGNKKEASELLGWCGTLWALTAVAGVYPMTKIATCLGKSRTVMIFLVVMAVGNLLKIVCYNRTYPFLTLIPTFMLSAGMLVLFTLIFSMVADVCDEDELKTGKRREGSYHALFQWLFKVGIGAASLMTGFFLNTTGFDAKLSMQSDSTLFWLRFWEISIPSCMCLIGALIMSKYPLTEQRAYEIKELLAKRRSFAADSKEDI